MLELSPLETAANASALSMPASCRTSRSKPMPITLVPLKEGPRRRNESALLSMTETVWLRSSRLRARVLPTRPHPMITTCTQRNATPPGPVRSGTSSRRRCAAPTWPSLAARGCRRRLEADHSRPQAALLAARRDAAPQAHRAAGLRQRRACRRWPTRRTRSSSCSRWPGPRPTSGRGRSRVAVALVMLTVVASYRQNVHAYPSGGGDYEVATVNLGQNAGVTVASALLVDYVLTVAVSISSGMRQRRGRAAVRLRARGALRLPPGGRCSPR